MARRSPTPEEVALWRLAMRDVAPLRPQAAPAVPAPPVVVAVAPPPFVAPPSAVASRSPPSPARQPPPPLELGATASIDRRTDDRLRRGQLVIEGRIDLHGMTQPAAHDALCHFLESGQRAGRRCVLVITGKGPVSQGGGVLRNAVPRWLAEPGLRRLIVAIHRAQPCHGGDGAMYVLLKRKRGEGK